MNGNQPFHFRTGRALIGLALVLLALQGTVGVMSAPPASWGPPEIYKYTASTRVGLGDAVAFTLTVVNPKNPLPPLVPVTWYDARMTDVLEPSLAIDEVSVQGDHDGYSVDGNTVMVTADRFQPGDWFVVVVYCTVVGSPERGNAITNTATLEYADEGGEPGQPLVSDPVTVTVPYRVLLPTALRNH